jgi:predicted MFS family arabinose efflux permease
MTEIPANIDKNRLLNAAVVVSALGYFVDVFDLLLFGVVRIKSLTSLGLSGQALTDAGISLQNWQMAGMLIGGVATGILGDKLGRVRALYGTIVLYSLANLANGFVYSIEAYAWCRFVAGIGLAGEIGAGITLVTESLPTRSRGLGATIMAAFGISGAVAAGMLDWFVADWRTAYFIGGGMGLALLALRVRVADSDVFKRAAIARTGVSPGNFFALFNNRERLIRLLNSTLLGVTTWFNTGILLFLSPEFGRAKGIPEPVSVATAVIWFHAGMVSGDVASGLLSQYWRSRLKAMRFFLFLQTIFAVAYLFLPLQHVVHLYVLLLLLGFSGGFWVIFITNASEQFGTNLRATAACTVPSLVRGLFVPMALAFQFLKSPGQTGSPAGSAALVGAVCLASAFWASAGLRETFDKDLDYLEK